MGEPNILLKEELRRLQKQNALLIRENRELKNNANLYHQAVNNSPNPIFSVDTDGIIQSYNPSCISTFLDGKAMKGEHFSLLLADPDQLAYVTGKLKDISSDTPLSNIDLSYNCNKGTVREMVSRVYPLLNEVEEVYGYVFANTDVTERNVFLRELEGYRNDLEGIVSERTAKLTKEINDRRQAEAALKLSHDSLAAILDGIEAEICVTDPGQTEVIFVNRHLKERFGNEHGMVVTIGDLAGRNWIREETEYLEPDRPGAGGREFSGTVHDPLLDRWYLVYEREIRWVDGRMVRLQVATDISERRRLDQEMLRVEKLESIGILAGGIAHDFNNLLVGILGSVSLVKCGVAATSTNYSLLTNIEKSAFRAKDLAHQLLTFSKGGEPVRKPTSLTSLLKETVEFATRGSNLRVEFGLAADDHLMADIDPIQITQALHNLVLNAVQAMPEGGRVSVSASCKTIEKYAVAPVAPGKYISVTLEDNGPGIPSENLAKIFDPYFSTKEKGSGLGLATVHTIIKKHQGHITVVSESGEGASFSILLPASEEQEVMNNEPAQAGNGGTGRILVMDDEKVVRDVAKATLEFLGYEVVTAREGSEALELYESGKTGDKPFDAVILDLTIRGGMGGKETIARLREYDPNVKAIVCSGYSNDPVMANYKDAGFSGVITKPYRVQEVASTLNLVLP